MSFRFNFTGDEVGDEERDEKKEEMRWLDSEEVIPCKQIRGLDIIHAKMFTCGDVEIGHIMSNEAIANMNSENALKLSAEENSDLVTGVYEGGLKIWECTNDMMQYLVENEQTIKIKDKRVLDLGCGAGILGIYAFQKGSEVLFQDYNKEVLEYVTIPNVLLNIDEDNDKAQLIKKCRFFSGDWSSFNKKLDDTEVFQIILTSETIYNEKNYEKLINLFNKRLDVNGTVYVAAKTCYFGVGGGIRQFENAVKNSKSFNCEVSWKNTTGIQREILKITRISQ